MLTFAADYLIMVAVACVGTVQVAAAFAGLRGLLFLGRASLAKAFGVLLIAAGPALFFATEERNLNDYEGGLDANQQAVLFVLGVVAGLGVTILVSSLLNRRMKGRDGALNGGLDSLRDSNFAAALARSLSYWKRNWRTQTRRYFSG